MIWIVGLLVLFAVMAFIDTWVVSYSDYVGTWIFGVVLVGSIIAIPISRYNMDIRVEQFEARKTTYIEQRELLMDSTYNSMPFIGEQMSLTQLIVDDNMWLARKQGAAKRLWFNWYYTEEILDVEPIKFEK